MRYDLRTRVLFVVGEDMERVGYELRMDVCMCVYLRRRPRESGENRGIIKRGGQVRVVYSVDVVRYGEMCVIR